MHFNIDTRVYIIHAYKEITQSLVIRTLELLNNLLGYLCPPIKSYY